MMNSFYLGNYNKILYRYRIFNNSLLSVRENQETRLILIPNGEVDVIINNTNVHLNQVSTPFNSKINYEYSTGVSCFLLTTINNTLFDNEENELKNKHDFFIFSFEKLTNRNIRKTTLYYVEENSIKYSEPNEEEQKDEWIFTLNTINHLENINDAFIKFRVLDNAPQKEIWPNETYYINLFFDNETLVNDIKVFEYSEEWNRHLEFEDDLTNINYNQTIKKSIAFLVPYEVSTTKINLYSPTFDFKNGWALYYLFKSGLFNSFALPVNFVSAETAQTVNNILNNVSTMLSGFQGMSDEEIKKFKKDVYGGSDPKQYANYTIQNYISKLDDKGQWIEAQKFQSIILGLSEYIPSDWSWRGGLTYEHHAGMLLYLQWKGKNSNLFNLKSKYITIGGTKNNNLEKLINLPNGFIPLPLLPDELEAQQVSNSPVDYNKNSYLLNYSFYISNDYSELWNNTIKRLATTPPPTTKTVKSTIFPFNDAEYGKIRAGSLLKLSQKKELWDYILRSEHNIPTTAQLVPNSLNLIKTQADVYSEEGLSQYNPTGPLWKPVKANAIQGEYIIYPETTEEQKPLIPFVYTPLNPLALNLKTGTMSIKIDNWKKITKIEKIIIKSIKGKNVVVNISNEAVVANQTKGSSGISFVVPLAQKHNKQMTTTTINIKDYINLIKIELN